MKKKSLLISAVASLLLIGGYIFYQNQCIKVLRQKAITAKPVKPQSKIAADSTMANSLESDSIEVKKIVLPTKTAIVGTVHDFLEPDNVINDPVKITLWRHTKLFTKKGIFVGLPESKPVTSTNFEVGKIGEFQFSNVRLDSTGTDYFSVEFVSQFYRAVYAVLICPSEERTDLGAIGLIKWEPYNTNLSTVTGVDSSNYRFMLEDALHDKTGERSRMATPPSLHNWKTVQACNRKPTNEPPNFNEKDFVWVFRLKHGYNGAKSSIGYKDHMFQTYGYGLWLHRDLYIAGVVEGEMGAFTRNPEALKAQAWCARTYTLSQEAKKPGNFGHAFSYLISRESWMASLATHGQSIRYNGQVIRAYYAARCPGDSTQAAHNGLWSPTKAKHLYGDPYPYLPSVRCSGHCDCKVFPFGEFESPCTEGEANEYIYGHGVGLCQRGCIEFCETWGVTAMQIIGHYYPGTNIYTEPIQSSG